MLRINFGLRCAVRFVGFGIEVGSGLVFFVEFVFLGVDDSIFDHIFRFVILVNIFIERSKPTKRRNVVFFGAERGCLALRFGNMLGQSGGFLFRKFMMRSVVGIGERFGFRFDLEVDDLGLGVVPRGKSFVCFVARTRARF